MQVDEKVLTCCHEGCGMVFAVPAWWESRRREDHTWWYCPNGHRQHFSADTEAEKLKRENDRLKQNDAYLRSRITEESARVDAVGRRLTATRGVITRIKNRVGHGVCPCCNRTFQDLARHMGAKHPAYAKDADSIAAE